MPSGTFLSSIQPWRGCWIKSHKSQAGQSQLKRTLESISLEGRACILMGGASDIGLEICRAILASGCEVAIVDANGEFAYVTLTVSQTILRIGIVAEQM